MLQEYLLIPPCRMIRMRLIRVVNLHPYKVITTSIKAKADVVGVATRTFILVLDLSATVQYIKRKIDFSNSNFNSISCSFYKLLVVMTSMKNIYLIFTIEEIHIKDIIKVNKNA